MCVCDFSHMFNNSFVSYILSEDLSYSVNEVSSN